MPPWARIVEGLAPEVRQFIEFSVPRAQERTATVLKAAETHFASQPKFLEQVREVVHPAAVHYRATRTGQGLTESAADVLSQWLTDSGQLAKGSIEQASAAKAGSVPKYQSVHMPANVEPIRQQAHVQDLQDRIKQLTLPSDARQRTYLQGKLVVAAQAVKGQQVIKDMPRALYLSPLSPVTKSDYVLGIQSRFPTDVAAATTTIDANTKGLRSAWRAVSNWFPNVGSTRAFRKDMQKLWESTLPMQERYYSQRERIEQLNKLIGQSANDPTALARATAARDRLAARTVQSYAELQRARKAAFSKYFNQPDVRIALYRELDTRPWVESLMNPKEVQVAQWHKQLMDNARSHADALGIPVLAQDKEYVTHLIHHIARGGSKRTADVQAYIDRMLPKMVKFAQRTPGSLQFYPSISSATESYITSSARKFGLTELMKRYEPLIEGPLKHWPRTQQYFTKYFKQFTDKVMDDKFFDKLFRGSTWWMYFSKTSLGLSVGRKHAEKAVGLLATHPLSVLQSIAPATKAGLQLAFQRAGAVPGSEARLIRNYLSSRTFAEGITGLTSPEKEHMKTIVNTLMAFPTSGIEVFERGIGVMAGLNKATHKGLSHDKTVQSIYQILIDQSFMGKADRFLWMGKPWQQLLGLFAYTPGRITDTTVKRILMSLPRKHVDELRNGVVQSAWKFPVDAFGTPYVKNTMMFLAGVGATELFARNVLDSTLWKEIAFHMHFLRERGGETEFYFWPAEVYTEGKKMGGKVSDPRPFVSALYDHMITFPQWQRYVRTAQGRIADIYGGSAARQVVALPKHSLERGLSAKAERSQERERTKARERREDTWPVGSVLRSLPPRVREFLYKNTGI